MPQFSLYQQYSINMADAAQCLERNLKESKNFANLVRVIIFTSISLNHNNNNNNNNNNMFNGFNLLFNSNMIKKIQLYSLSFTALFAVLKNLFLPLMFAFSLFPRNY